VNLHPDYKTPPHDIRRAASRPTDARRLVSQRRNGYTTVQLRRFGEPLRDTRLSNPTDHVSPAANAHYTLAGPRVISRLKRKPEPYKHAHTQRPSAITASPRTRDRRDRLLIAHRQLYHRLEPNEPRDKITEIFQKREYMGAHASRTNKQPRHRTSHD